MRVVRPLFIVFEGIDGSGKSSLSEELDAALRSQGLDAVRLAEPTDGTWGRKIRAMLSDGSRPEASEQLRLFLLDREEDVARNLLPALRGGGIVLMDRYFYSNAAYQGAAGMDPDLILSENRARGFPQPNRVYLVDIEPEKALQRIAMREGGRNVELFERLEFLARVREIYLAIVDERFVILDGRLPLLESVGVIMEDIEKNFTVR